MTVMANNTHSPPTAFRQNDFPTTRLAYEFQIQSAVMRGQATEPGRIVGREGTEFSRGAFEIKYNITFIFIDTFNFNLLDTTV